MTSTPLYSHEQHRLSISNPSSYWDTISSKINWFSPYTSIQSGSFENGDVAWFLNGKLNACFNAIDRWVNTRGSDIAIRWEGDDPHHTKCLTYKDLLLLVCRVANALKSTGVRRGDVVTIYMPMIPEIAITMLACARIGAVHSVIFAGFSSESIATRIQTSRSQWIITCDGGKRGGKYLPLKQICDVAVDLCGDLVKNVLVFHNYDRNNDNLNVKMNFRDVDMDTLIAKQEPSCPCEHMDSEDPLFILYTSGSTGNPKGLVHTTGGYCLYALETTKTSFDLQSNDVYACMADAGWITGHTYIVYGPLLNGSNTFLFESTPTYPHPGRYWETIQRHHITILYTAPTAIRSLMRFGNDIPKQYDLSSLRILGTVGEPINPEAWRWYHTVIGNSRCTVVDTYWQTETGGHVITNSPGVKPRPGSCALPLYGIDAVVLDPLTGDELSGSAEGVLAIKQPWPGMARTCINDHEGYLKVYMKPYKGYYFTGDGCHRDEDGYFWITGRVDDVLNVSGHRIGTAEVESALVAQPEVSQAGVVGFPHPIKGEGICCYCTLAKGYEESKTLITKLRMAVRSGIGKFATPDDICITPGLPLTRSGKIMRRILRKIASGEVDQLGDTTTLADPCVVDALIEKMSRQRKR